MQRSRNHGLAHHREPQGTAGHNAHQPADVVQRPSAHLPGPDRRVLPLQSQSGASFHLCHRHPAGRTHGARLHQIHRERRRQSVCDGTSALPDADRQSCGTPHLGQRQAIPQENGRHHHDRFHHHLVLGYYPNHEAYATTAEQQENSYIGRLGKAIEPAIEPLGFDWKMGIGILSGVGAKELVVSTLSVLYTNEDDVENINLSERIPITPLAAYGYMLFVLIYFPCIATIAAIRQESGSWKWAAFAALYTTALAWIVSFAVYQIGSLF